MFTTIDSALIAEPGQRRRRNKFNTVLSQPKDRMDITPPKKEQDIDEILSRHGGNFQPDFGVAKSITFDNGLNQSQNGWGILLQNITGKGNNQRVGNIISKINQDKALKYHSGNDTNGENFIRALMGNTMTAGKSGDYLTFQFS